MDAFETLMTRITTRQARVGVLGLGYVGLPLAQAFVDRDFAVVGFDTDADRVASLDRGVSCIGVVPHEALQAMRSRGFQATTEFDRLADVDVILICVPTPLTESREPDLGDVMNAARSVARSLHAGQLVVLESTTYPGTTRQVVLPLLETGPLRMGRDYFLAYSPERQDPGNQNWTVVNVPKVVGGTDRQSLELALALYSQVVARVVPVSSAEVAEASKVLENTYRAVNIALVNELKILCDRIGIDIWEVIEAARTKPFGFQAFYPGPGLGGHCLPIDPFYLAWLARKHGLTTRFIELAGEVNTSMPLFVLDKIGDALNRRNKPIKDSAITVLGVAYKKDLDDIRESPGLALMELLLRKGAVVRYNDPHVPQIPNRCPEVLRGVASVLLTPAYLHSQDCIVVVTDHSAYDWDLIVEHASLVVDTRNATRGVMHHRDRIVLA